MAKFNAQYKVWEEEFEGEYYSWECKACAFCEHRFECDEKEMFWGCEHWEEEMGEDL